MLALIILDPAFSFGLVDFHATNAYRQIEGSVHVSILAGLLNGAKIQNLATCGAPIALKAAQILHSQLDSRNRMFLLDYEGHMNLAILNSSFWYC